MRLLPEVVYAKGYRTLKRRGDILGCVISLSIAYAAISTLSDLVLLSSGNSHLGAILAGDVAFIYIFMAMLLLCPLIMGIVVKGVSSVMEGDVNWRKILISVGRGLPRILIAMVVYAGALVGIFISVVALSVGTGSLACICVGLPIAAVLVFYVALRLSLVLQWILLGEEGVIVSFLRSWSMTSGHVGFMLVLHLPLYVVILVTSALRPWLLDAVAHLNIWDPTFLPALLILWLFNFLNMLFMILLESALTIAYLEMKPSGEEKVRREMEREMGHALREDYSWV
jgi:hypothetical protein